MANKIPVIGMLGGIGSGKSTMARQFGRLGCAVIDADAIAHDVLKRPEIIAAIAERFGPGVLDPAERIDRVALAERVFERQEDLAFLNALVHPRVLERCEQLIARYRADNCVPSVILDMPLLLETGWEKKCDFLVFVECDRSKRLERIRKKGKIDEKQLKKRENFQISLDKKKEIAHYMIYNNSDESDSAEQIAQLFSIIAKK